MNNTIFSFIIAFSATFTFSQDSVSVLFIGNSYTYVNDLPLMLNDLSNSLGDILTYDSRTQGGATFQTHAVNTSTYTKINSKPWDFVVLQAQSQEPSFPESQVDSQTIPPAMQMADSIYANNICSDIMLFMTWGREDGDPQWTPISTFDGMNARLRSAYIRIADSVQGSVSAVGSAWKYVRDNNPSINLYAGDGSHPSVEGSYLAACTFYAALYRKSPVGAPFISTLSPATAAILQDAAALTVLDSLEFWNLHPVSEHTQAEFSFVVNNGSAIFTNQSSFATDYHWEFGDLISSTEVNPTHTFPGNGSYEVFLIAESPCDSDTVSYFVNITTASIHDNLKSDLNLSYLGGGFFKVNELDEIKSINVFDMEGRLIRMNSSSLIDLSSRPFGLYFLQIETNNTVITLRLPYFYE